MSWSDEARLPEEARARVLIDGQLQAAGWAVQDGRALNLFGGQGIAVRERVMAPGHGRVDYLLYVDRQVVGVIEAKPLGTTLSGVEWQSSMYATGLPEAHRRRARVVAGRLPFVFEASGSETHFTDGFDLEPRARRVFSFPQPTTLARILREAEANPEAPTWRAKVRHLPALEEARLRRAQAAAIRNVERSLAEQRFDRSLVQMATGAGKTFAAVTLGYRLLKFGGFTRVLFLVDRNNLGDQTLAEFQNYTTPDDGRRFGEIYNVDKLTGAGMLASSDVVISTIQRVHAVLRGREVAAIDDPELDGYVPETPVSIDYSRDLPPEAFDLVIVDEAHRSIYGVWRPVLEYFDAHVVGLTATPGKQTFAFFRQNLVSEPSGGMSPVRLASARWVCSSLADDLFGRAVYRAGPPQVARSRCPGFGDGKIPGVVRRRAGRCGYHGGAHRCPDATDERDHGAVGIVLPGSSSTAP
jgi:type I restriction enzyme, R subunit